MSLPAVQLNEIDGALGSLPSGVRALAFVGPCSSGTNAVPAAYASTKALDTAFASGGNDGGGPTVEAAAYAIVTYGKPVIVCKTNTTTAGSLGVVAHSGAGTSVVTATGTPDDDYELYLKIITGGTIGVAGITFQYSLDNGRTLSPVQALGVANTFAFPRSGGATFNFGAGTTLANQVETALATAPKWNTADVQAAIAALLASGLAWDVCFIVGPWAATDFDTISAAIPVATRDKLVIGNFRVPTSGETDATYTAAFNTAFGAKAATNINVCAGACLLVSARTGRIHIRPIAFPEAPREVQFGEHVDIAELDRGPLTGVSIRDANGNPVANLHDEAFSPGLDDMRATTLRTWEEAQGVYVTNPRLLSPAGSDFEFTQHRKVMNLAKRALRSYMVRRLSKAIQVDKNTGFILESEALEIESGADKAIRSVLMAGPKASGGGYAKGQFVRISRTDNILSTKKITGAMRVIPLAYPKFIELDVGFFNPALQLIAV